METRRGQPYKSRGTRADQVHASSGDESRSGNESDHKWRAKDSTKESLLEAMKNLTLSDRGSTDRRRAFRKYF